MKKSSSKCLNPNCKRVARSRGLCASCYATACRLVKRGDTTYDALVKAGKMCPTARVRTGSTASWLLGK